MTTPILQVEHLKLHFPVHSGLRGRSTSAVRAVDDVSFTVMPHEVLGLVGESGCGKTTVGRAIVRLYRPTSGRILFEKRNGGQVDLAGLSPREMMPYRRELKMVFQDPFSSLNPRLPVREIIAEPLIVHRVARGSALTDRVERVMEQTGLDPAYMNRYPHEFSGGQRQRIGLARALVLQPRLVIADEPVSALDVSVQAQIINLLQELRDELGLTIIFIAHDLAVVEHISRRIAVMYVGKLVEIAPAGELLTHPLHPYAEALISAIPPGDPDVKKERIRLEGEVPSPTSPPPGCVFSTRCRYATEKCRTQVPDLEEIDSGRWVSCHRAAELNLRGLDGG